MQNVHAKPEIRAPKDKYGTLWHKKPLPFAKFNAIFGRATGSLAPQTTVSCPFPCRVLCADYVSQTPAAQAQPDVSAATRRAAWFAYIINGGILLLPLSVFVAKARFLAVAAHKGGTNLSRPLLRRRRDRNHTTFGLYFASLRGLQLRSPSGSCERSRRGVTHHANPKDKIKGTCLTTDTLLSLCHRFDTKRHPY